MKELDELFEWVWGHAKRELEIIREYECEPRGEFDLGTSEGLICAVNRRNAYYRVMREIRAMKERNQK